MKNTERQLANRGYLSNDGFNELIKKNSNIDDLLKSPKPYERTFAIRVIRKKKDESYVICMIDILQKENKLYTKIELCKCLAEFSSISIPFLIPFLGRMGKNQHKKICLVDINKKTYPLPRDIVARILANIGSPALPYLREILLSENRIAICEAIDAIGHIAFGTNDYSLENELVQLYFRKKDDDLIKWNLIRCFQSFESIDILKILNKVAESDETEHVFRIEAQRSLSRIGSRKDHSR